MASNRDLHEAERLDRLWDDLASAPTDAGDGLLQLIRKLEAGAPTMSHPQRERVLGNVVFPPAAAAGSPTPAIGSAISIDPALHPPTNQPRLEHPILQIAATILLLIGIASAWLVVRSNDSSDQTAPGVSVASPSTQNPSQPAFLASLDVPGSYLPQYLTLTIRRIVLAPNAVWDLEPNQSQLVDRGIVSGSVRIQDDSGYAVEIEGPSSFGLNDHRLVSIENTGGSEAILIELAVSSATKALPEPPNGSTSEIVGITSYTTVSGQGANFILTRAVGDQIERAAPNSPNFPVIFGAVESGSFRWTPEVRDFESTPETAPNFNLGNFQAGSIIESSPGGFTDLYANSDDSSILLLAVRAITPMDVAEWGESSTVDSVGEPLSVDIRMITVQPGGHFSFRMDGSMLAWGLTGTASIASGLSPDATAIVPDLFSTVSGSSTFTISALGNQSARFVLARVSRVPVEELESDSTEFELTGAGNITMPTGTIDARLSFASSSSRFSGVLENESQLILITGGTYEFIPITDMTVNTGDGSLKLAAFSDPVDLETGDSFVAESSDGFALAPLDWKGQSIKLSLTMKVPETSGATPSASSSPLAGASFDVMTDECTVEPRSLDEYEAILATPYAQGSGAINHNGDANGMPATQEQIDGVTATMRQAIACNQIGTLYRYLSIESDAQLQYAASDGFFDLEYIRQLANGAENADVYSPYAGQLLIAEIEQFPDGRVGAWVAGNGGMVSYVTFVFENGQWLIDFWDDASNIDYSDS